MRDVSMFVSERVCVCVCLCSSR